MSFVEVIKNKYLSIFRNDQLRIILTTIGITIAGLIFLLGSMIIDTMKYNMYERVDELPNNVIVHLNITDKQYNYLRKVEGNKALIPFESTELEKFEYINEDNYRIRLRVIGTHNDFVTSVVPYQSSPPTSKINYIQGRVWTSEESEKNLNVVVITYFTSTIFFRDENPLGKKISIPNYGIFTVIGVINDLKEYEDSYDRINYEESTIDTPIAHIFMPLNTYKDYNFNYDKGITSCLLQQNDDADLIFSALQNSVYADTFKNSYTRNSSLRNFDDELEVFNTVFIIVIMVVTILSFIIIINTLLFSVKNRIHEIGIRIALGARRKSILYQFIYEALILAVISIILSLAILYIVIQLLNIGIIKDLIFTIFFESIIRYIIGFIFVITVASSIPAYYASRVNVIDILRLD